jgi:hypothetical protein
MGRVQTYAPMLLAAALLAIGIPAAAQELHLFPASAPEPRYFSSFDVGGAAGFRIADLGRSYPWSESERSGFGLGTETTASAPDSEEQAAGSVPMRRCVLVQCVKISGQPEPPPKKLFTTPVTLWTVAGLVAGIANGYASDHLYGIQKFHFTDERFFQYDTYAGGSDKVSHFIVSANSVDLLYDAYRLNRLTPDQAFWLSWATVTLAGVFVEVGDGLVPYGFSAQDVTADTLGALAEGLIKRNNLDDLLGFRVGKGLPPVPPALVENRTLFGIDYSEEIYTADLKLGGLACRLHASPDIARFFLFSFTYNTKGYGYDPPLPTRYQEVGLEVGLNLVEVLKAVGVTNSTWWGDLLLRTFTFFRIPYTQVGAYYNLKNQKWYGPGAPYHFY